MPKVKGFKSTSAKGAVKAGGRNVKGTVRHPVKTFRGTQARSAQATDAKMGHKAGYKYAISHPSKVGGAAGGYYGAAAGSVGARALGHSGKGAVVGAVAGGAAGAGIGAAAGHISANRKHGAVQGLRQANVRNAKTGIHSMAPATVKTQGRVKRKG